MASTVNPYAFNNSFGLPLSPKVSFIPTFNTGTGHSSVKTSATAEPKPPIILCSSAVTIAPVSLAALANSSLSMVLLYVYLLF